MKQVVVGILIGLFIPAIGWPQGILDTPADGSSVSSIGYIRGWKCTGGSLTYSIDNSPPVPLSYGGERGDTAGMCGDTNNGFITQQNWNLLPTGQHTIRVFDNGQQFAQATFSVKTLGHEYLTGISAESKVVNFGNQINVTIRWQESCQCFVIVDSTAPFRTGPPTGVDLGPSVPLCEQPDAGRFAAAGAIYAFDHQAGFLQRNVSLCAVSPDNPRYVLIQGNALSSPQGVIFYDVTLLNEIDGIDPFADTFVLAHELGHQIQYDNFARVSQLSQKQLELQADCFAGIYIGHLDATDPQFMDKDRMGLAEAICGVVVGKNLSWGNIFTHGLCEERAAAFAMGALAQLSAEASHLSFDPFLVCSF